MNGVTKSVEPLGEHLHHPTGIFLAFETEDEIIVKTTQEASPFHPCPDFVILETCACGACAPGRLLPDGAAPRPRVIGALATTFCRERSRVSCVDDPEPYRRQS